MSFASDLGEVLDELSQRQRRPKYSAEIALGDAEILWERAKVELIEVVWK